MTVLAALPLLLMTATGCHSARAVRPPDIRPTARIELWFRTPIDLTVARPDGAVDTLRAVQHLQGRYQGASGDTVILHEVTYADRHRTPRRAPRGSELRYHRAPERLGRDGEVREVRFSPGRTLAAITLPVLVPVGLLVLLISL